MRSELKRVNLVPDEGWIGDGLPGGDGEGVSWRAGELERTEKEYMSWSESEENV